MSMNKLQIKPDGDFQKYLAGVDLAEQVLRPELIDTKRATAEELDEVFKRLRTPERFIRSFIYVHNGGWAFDKLWCGRIQFSRAKGQPNGGTRFEKTATEDTNLFLASEMNNKNPNVGIWHGGGKGVISVDKFKYTKLHRELFCRGYIDILEPYIGPTVDGLAPDVNTTGQEMSWFLSELNLLRGSNNSGAFTGKPVGNGGSLVRDIATGLGAIYVTMKMVDYMGLSGQVLTCGIDGAGNAGLNYGLGIQDPKIVTNFTAKVVTLSDRGLDDRNDPFGGFIAKKEGFTVEELKAIDKWTRDMKGDKVHKICEYIAVDPTILTGIEAFQVYLDADFVAPSANKNRVLPEMARVAKWKFGIELANGPCTIEASDILDSRHIPFAPDNFASGGGVRVSSAEKSQGLANAPWTREEVIKWLRDGMDDNFDQIVAIWKKYNLKGFRDAANVNAIKINVEAMLNLGGLYLPYGEIIDAMPIVVSPTPHDPRVIAMKTWVVLTNPDKIGTLLLRSIRRWIAPFTRHYDRAELCQFIL